MKPGLNAFVCGGFKDGDGYDSLQKDPNYIEEGYAVTSVSSGSDNKRQKTNAIEAMANAVIALAESSVESTTSQKWKEQLDFIQMLTNLESQVSRLYTELENCTNEQCKSKIQDSINYYENCIESVCKKVHDF